jgi:nucleoside-diphosphate-sugar epimerase
MKVLVTGGSGFIGTRLLELLNKSGEVGLINLDKANSDTFCEITTLADIRDLDALINATKDVDVIYNLAAEHADNVTPLSLYEDVNVGGAVNIVRAAKTNNVKHIVFTSSVAIYGLNRGTPDEKLEPQPFNEYGRTKLAAEKVFDQWYAETEGSTLVTVRPAVVFGENNRGNVYNLINQIVSGRFVMIGNGQNCKSMGYVGNVAEFLKQQLDKKPGYYVYNYADKPDLSSQQIVDIVLQEMGLKSSSLKIPYSVGLLGGYVLDLVSKVTCKKFPVSAVRVQKFCADTTINCSAAMSSGFNPPYSLEDGLRNMVNHEFK